MSLSVDVTIDPEENLLGKVVGDLQANVVVGTDALTGTLHYLDDYTGFSEDTSLQVGNFIALHAEVEDVEDVTLTVEGVDAEILDEDGIIICRVEDKSSQTISIVASKQGVGSVTKTFDLSGLTCETA